MRIANENFRSFLTAEDLHEWLRSGSRVLVVRFLLEGAPAW
jgi:hypothetical protein